jgi:hypothetical protein
VAHEQPHLRRESDRPALLERDWRIVDHEAELGSHAVVWGGVLECVQELAKQLPKLIALVLGQPSEQSAGGGQLLRRAGLKELPSTVGERDNSAAAVLWIGLALDQASLHEAVDSQAYRPGRQSEL